MTTAEYELLCAYDERLWRRFKRSPLKSAKKWRYFERHSVVAKVVAVERRLRGERGDDLENIKGIIMRLWPRIEEMRAQ